MLDAPRVAEAMGTYLVESSPVLALMADQTLSVTGANRQASLLLGDNLLGRPLQELFVNFDEPLNLAAIIQQTGTDHRLSISTLERLPETLIFRFFDIPEGTLVLASPDFREQQGLRDAALVLNRQLNDLTRELHQVNAELRDLNELKSRFVGMAAHDLRNPLGLIINYGEFLVDEASECLDEEQRGFLGTILAAAEGMRRNVENFLDMAVIESGQLRVERSPTTVSDIVLGALTLVRRLTTRKKITVITRADCDQTSLKVDGPQLQQVLMNLLGNAVEFSNEGQRVWLTTHREGQNMVFQVRDEGPGMSEFDQKDLFAPFVRAGTRKTGGERSRGLGLAIARLIVEAHGGRIWVESTVGLGSSFYFEVPAEDRAHG